MLWKYVTISLVVKHLFAMLHNDQFNIYVFIYLLTQDSLFSTYCTVINEGPAIKFLMRVWAHIVHKIQDLSS